MLSKNEIIENVTLTDLNNLGNGICHVDGQTVFVKNAVDGDICDIKIIKVTKSYAVARIEKLLSPSVYRVDPVCPNYKRCGGCVYRPVDYSHEVELKKNYIINAFRKAGLEVEVKDCLHGSPDGYRNKVQYPMTTDFRTGYYARRTHEIVPGDGCLLQKERFGPILNALTAFFKEKNIPAYEEENGKGTVRHICIRSGCEEAGSQTSVCIVVNSDRLPFEKELGELLFSEFPEIVSFSVNINKEKTNVILGNKTRTVKGKDSITDILCGVKFDVSPASFYQVNHDMAEVLYRNAAELADLKPGMKLADLFCGAGTVGISMVSGYEGCRLVGIDINEASIKNAQSNARRAGIEAEFICSDANSEELNDADVVVIDPPRKGIERKLAERLAELKIPKIVYISCDPDTLARDCRAFTELGYNISEVRPVDLFPRTGHVESVVLMSRAGS